MTTSPAPLTHEPSTLDAPISAVTVYPDRARITRRARVELSPGRHRVFVEPLPSATFTDSIRVAGRGAALILGVDVVPRRQERSPDADAADLDKRRRELAAEITEIDDVDRVQFERSEFLRALARRAAGTFSRQLAEGGAGFAAASEFADGVEQQRNEVNARRRELLARRESVSEALEVIERRLQDITHKVDPDRLAAAVDLDVTEAGEVELELSYLVGGGSWQSTYDLRLVGERLALTWYALVSQRTGEDWPECELTLSTARPSRTAAVPELYPWYLDRVRPVPPPYPPPGAPAGMQPQAARAMSAPDDGLTLMRAAAAPMAEATAAVEQGVSAATYRTARPVAVPGDGGTHRATVTAFDLDAALDYVTAPVTSLEANLRATVVNSSEHTLLPGKAAVFAGADFVGNTPLTTWAPGEEIELALGIDDRIRVEREVVGRKASKATIGSSRRHEIEYLNTVTNHTPGTARITVLDQVPVSRDEEIGVREVRVAPSPAERTDLGVLTWRFELAPGASAEAQVAIRVDLPKGVEMYGWRE